MLEYFTYKKVKKHKEEKQRLEKDKEEAAAAKSSAKDSASPGSPKIISQPEGTPILDKEDERFLERLTSPDAPALDDEDEGTPPPLPPRIKTPVIDIDSDASSVASILKNAEADGGGKGKGKNKEKAELKANDKTSSAKRFSFVTNLSRNISLKRKPQPSRSELKPSSLAVPEKEASKEKSDIARVLDDLDLSAQNNKAFSLSKESAEMVQKFTQVLKDLVNGVPTAYGDLVNLIEDRDGILARSYEKLPKSLKKLVTQLPEKLTTTLAPELLAVAAEAQGLSAASEEAGKEGLKDAARKFLTPKNLQELVTKPGAVAGLLKGIVNALKTRWPAFIGTNVLWSVAVFLLLSALWYCHKRGREERLLREGKGADEDPIDGRERIEELPDDPQLPAAASSPAAKGSGSGSNKVEAKQQEKISLTTK
ncbi:hypothetical protein F4778DRAFT_418469 [Xylariomycetidae sp. FL2044]|nr:hypothetical protein F4778DRAFT_418469 [Xylariomycetidae sp. FL2044]